MGKGSVASVVAVLLAIMWYMAAVFLAIAVCYAVVSPFLDVSGGELGLPVSFSVDPAAHRITAPALGVDHAQIEKASGTLRFPIFNGLRPEIDPSEAVRHRPRVVITGHVRPGSAAYDLTRFPF